MGVVRTKPGRVFNASLVEKTIEELTVELASRGYAFAQVRPRGDRDYTNHTISVTYIIDEGNAGLCRADRYPRQHAKRATTSSAASSRSPKAIPTTAS